MTAFAVSIEYARLGEHAPPGALADAFRDASDLGFTHVETVNQYWCEFEPTLGRFNWDGFERYAQASRATGLPVIACSGGLRIPGNPSNYRGDRVPTPDGVEFTGDFRDLLTPYCEFLDGFFARYADVVPYFTLHSEGCGRYFPGHPDEVATYGEFLAGVADYIHDTAPGVVVGACLDDVDLGLAAELHAGLDLSVFLYQPKQPPYTTELARRDLGELLALAGDRPIALNETFHWSSALAGASAAIQAQYVADLMDFVYEHRDRFEFVTWWSLRDDDPAIWAEIGRIVGMPGEPITGLREYAFCGLLDRDGNPTPAAERWLAGVRRVAGA